MSDVATKLLEIQNQLKVYHWQTNSYARHMAYGGAHDDMVGLIDNFVEVMMGKTGRVLVSPIKLVNRSEKKAEQFIDETISWLNSLSTQFASDTDLLNIRDEMLSVFNKLKYLLTLK